MVQALDQAGLLYVNSRITSRDLATDVFNDWYSGEHVPDVLNTGGVQCAFRFYTANKAPNTVERPYLALYAAPNTGLLINTTLKEVPVHSDKLPGPTKCIFDLAEFDVRIYLTVGKTEPRIDGHGPTGFLATVQFAPPSDLEFNIPEKLVKWYGAQDQTMARRIRLFRLYSANKNDQVPEEYPWTKPPPYLALHEYASHEELASAIQALEKNRTAAGFKVLEGFGNQEHDF